MKLNKFEAALRARFATPQEALRCLGIDENILNGENNDNRRNNMARVTARDQAMTIDDLVEAIESLSEEERLELKDRLGMNGEGEDRRGFRGTGRDRRGARDDPPPFPGRPNTGGSMDPLDRDREDAQDRRRLAGDSRAYDPRAYDDWARRYPDAARVKVVMASAALRHVGGPPAPPRTPERQALDEAARRYKAANERVERLQQALATARYNSTDKLHEVGVAEETLVDAVASAPKRRAAEILGEEVPAGPSLEEAQRALNSAQASYDANKGAIEVLDAELNDDLRGAKARASSAQTAAERALAAVLATDPGIDALIEAFDAARARVATLATVLKFLGLTRLPERHQGWQSTNRALPPYESPLSAWQAAIMSLEAGDVDTQLPAVPTT